MFRAGRLEGRRLRRDLRKTFGQCGNGGLHIAALRNLLTADHTRRPCEFTGDTFDLCPADICKTTGGQELQRSACPVDAPKTGLRVEGYTPPDEIIHAVERIMREADIEVGGVEYIIDDRDGQLYYYDINALSNFVADGPKVIGFDPFVRLVDFLEQEAA